MSHEVYYKQDIINALSAAGQASNAALEAVGGDDPFTAGYEAGYRAALVTVALAFGLVAPDTSDHAITKETLEQAIVRMNKNKETAIVLFPDNLAEKLAPHLRAVLEWG